VFTLLTDLVLTNKCEFYYLFVNFALIGIAFCFLYTGCYVLSIVRFTKLLASICAMLYEVN